MRSCNRGVVRESVYIALRYERGIGVRSRDAACGNRRRFTAPRSSCAFEVDVLPVEPEQLAAAQAGVREEREQEPVALALARVAALPDVVAFGRIEQAAELAPVEDVRQRLALLRRAQHLRRVAVDLLVLEQEAEEALECGDGARLARRRWAPDRLVDEETAQVGRPHLAYRDDSLPREEGDTSADVALVGGAGERREPPLDAAVVEEVGEFLVHQRPFGRPKAAAPKLVTILRLTGLLRKKPWKRGVSRRRMSDELASVEPDGPLYRLGRQPSPTDEELGGFDRGRGPRRALDWQAVIRRVVLGRNVLNVPRGPVGKRLWALRPGPTVEGEKSSGPQRLTRRRNEPA
jgi:hypothetical protein